jgi:uncharacterized delta-60 repeat protein
MLSIPVNSFSLGDLLFFHANRAGDFANSDIPMTSNLGLLRTAWVARFNGPADIRDDAYDVALDAYGNVYVTGRSDWDDWEPGDIVTIKYDAEGNEMWIARYDGPGDGLDTPDAIAVDAEGNVYVAGESWGGVETSMDCATIKYDTDGNEMWVARYDGPISSWDAAHAISLDADGNIYVTGERESSGTNWDYTTIKYNPDGNELWVALYKGLGIPEYSRDIAHAIALDDLGNVYVTGESDGESDYAYDYATVKYDTDGNELWVARYNGPGDGVDIPHAISLDASGNVYVTGESEGSGTYFDFATLKYDTDGNELWAARHNGPENDYDDRPGNSYDRAGAIAVDASGNIYVTGTIDWGNSERGDYATIKYDTDGNELWVARYNGPGNYTDDANAMALDAFGNVYVTGSSYGSGSFSDYATVKYDTDGNVLWVERYNGPGNYRDVGFAMALDDRNVYVAGFSYGFGIQYDYCTIKYIQNPPAQVIPGKR